MGVVVGVKMTAEQHNLRIIRDFIATMSEDEQIRIEAIAVTLRNIVKADSFSRMALALVGAEMAAQS